MSLPIPCVLYVYSVVNPVEDFIKYIWYHSAVVLEEFRVFISEFLEQCFVLAKLCPSPKPGPHPPASLSSDTIIEY